MYKYCFFLFLGLLTSRVSAQATWQYLPSAPNTGSRIEDVFFLNSQLGWAASGGGKIYKTTDGGQTWATVYSTNSYFRCIEFRNDSIGYAGTLDNKFLRSADGGHTWTNLTPNISPKPKAVCGISIVDDEVAYAVGEWDTPAFVLKTVDGGQTWINQSMASQAKALVDVLFLSRDTGFIAGQNLSGQGAIFYTTDGGQNWAEKFSSSPLGQYVWKIQRVTPDFWVGSIQTFNGGLFAKSYDGGQTWSQHTAPIPDMQGIGFATPLRGWVGGYVSGFHETNDGGETWQFQNFGGNYNRFYFLDSTLGFASGASIYKFSELGMSSTQPSLPTQGYDDGFSLSLAPNPVRDFLSISFDLPVRDNVRISIYSPDGRWIQEVYHERQIAPGQHRFQADCSQLQPGAYFIGVQRNHGLYAYPFIRQ